MGGYTVADQFFYRAATFPIDEFSASSTQTAVMYTFRVNESFRLAVQAASPSLYRALSQEPPADKAIRSLLKYWIRATTRATPRGLFAGVGLGQFINSSPVRHVALHAAYQHEVDKKWAYGVVDALENDLEVLPELRVFLDPGLYEDRTLLKLPPHETLHSGSQTFLGASVRLTPAMKTVVTNVTKSGVAVRDLSQQLKSAGVDQKAALHFIRKLIQIGYLYTDARMALEESTPSGILSRLDEIAGVSSSGFFETSQNDLSSFVNVTYVKPIFELPQFLGGELAKAVELALHLSASPETPPRFTEFLERFRATFGSECFVPVAQVFDQDCGLEAPEGYLKASNKRFRDNPWLLELVTAALRRCDREIVLSDSDLRAIHLSSSQRSPSSLEVICRVDESAKETTLIIKPGTMLGGYARFGLRFSQDFQSNLNQQIANCELRHEPEHLHVDLTYVSSAGNIANVIARPKLGQAELSMGLTTGVETNGKNALPASDLHIGILNNRLVLASRQYQQLVSLHLRTRLNSEVGNPLVKLLHDCASQSLGHWSGFHWGTLEELPFTPRIRYKQVVIAPATWRFRGSTWEEFSEFATTWYIPRYIYAFIENTELLLDRDVPDHQELLRAAVTKSSRERVPFLLFEAPSDPVSSAPRFGSTAHATEVAITLFAKSKDPNYTARGLEPWMFTPIARTQFLPGSEWLYFKIHIHHNLIASFMLDFQVALEEVAGWDVWHFVRFHEFGKSQVRIRIRVVDEDGRQTAHVRLTSYLNRDPRVNSFSVETYVPEYHRYGGTDIAEPLEHVYNADSTFTLEALKYGFPHAEAAVLGVAQILETLSRGDRTLIKRVGHTARLREGAKRKESSSHIVTASTMESLHERMRTRGEALQQYSNYLQVSSWETLVFCATRLSHLHLNRMGIPTHSESPFIQGAKRLLLAKEQGGKQS